MKTVFLLLFASCARVDDMECYKIRVSDGGVGVVGVLDLPQVESGKEKSPAR